MKNSPATRYLSPRGRRAYAKAFALYHKKFGKFSRHRDGRTDSEIEVLALSIALSCAIQEMDQPVEDKRVLSSVENVLKAQATGSTEQPDIIEQMRETAEEVESWPEWQRQAAGLPPRSDQPDELTRLRETIADWEYASASNDRLVRELDIALNGEAVAAKQASLCDIVAQVKAMKRESAQPDAITKLQAFKDYVHQRLDEAGIPTHPNGEHSKHGCRIGDRLDIALKRESVKEDSSPYAVIIAYADHLPAHLILWAQNKIKQIEGGES